MANCKTTTYPPTVDRRAILATFAGGLCIPAVATVPMRSAGPNPLDVIRRMADLLADQMAEVHGGTWLATLDHASGFVLIRPRLSEESRAALLDARQGAAR